MTDPINNPNVISDLIINDAQPTRADAVKNRALLLETARDLFERKGVESVSMTELAQAAGVGKGTLYRHFNNKAEVCYALLDHEQRDLQARTLARLSANGDPYEDMMIFLADVVRFVVRNDDLLASGLHDGNVSSLTFAAHAWYRQTIHGLLAKLALDADLDYLSDVLYVMVNVDTIHYQRHTLGYDLERIRAGLLDTFARLAAE